MPIFRVDDKIIHFVHIPKTGGTSIEKWLSGRYPSLFLNGKIEGIESTLQHLDQGQYSNLLKGWVDYEFTVVRNPYERIISAYRWRYARASESGEYVPPFKLWLFFKFWRSGIDPRIDDNFYLAQSDFISERTKVFRFEDGLDSAMSQVCDDLFIVNDEKLPHFYKTKKLPVEIDDWCLSNISKKYKIDFDRFGYDREFLVRSGDSSCIHVGKIELGRLLLKSSFQGLPLAVLRYIKRRL